MASTALVRRAAAPRLEELLILLFVAIATYTTLACASRFLPADAATNSRTAVRQTYAVTPLADDAMRRDGTTGLDADLLLQADINAATAAVEQRDDVSDDDSPSDRDLAEEGDVWHGQPFP